MFICHLVFAYVKLISTGLDSSRSWSLLRKKNPREECTNCILVCYQMFGFRPPRENSLAERFRS